MIELVISGGQSGADYAGLVAAKLHGIKTGGWMPKGWKTLDGSRPEYAELYGMKEHLSPHYKDRTWANVQWADATVRFATDFKSPGEVCTLNAIKMFNRPYFDVSFDSWFFNPKVEHFRLINFIENNDIKILNIAGNSNRTFFKMYDITFEYLVKTFNILGK